MRSHRIIPHEPDPCYPKIYGLKDPRHGQFCWVGQAIDPEKRLRQHLDGKRHEPNYNKAAWFDDMHHAKVMPELVILEVCTEHGQADEAEARWINNLLEEGHPLTNIAKGGLGTRSGSKLQAARKRDWIEHGYITKTARDATQRAMTDLANMLPKGSREVRLLKKAVDAINIACSELDDRLCQEYPSWDNFTKVYYTPAREHFAELKRERDQANLEAMSTPMQAPDLKRIMNVLPELCSHGIGVKDQPAEALVKARTELAKSLSVCNQVRAWLLDVKKTEGVNPRIGSSYRLKHIAEQSLGYVSNGAFIAAAIYCGFRYRIDGQDVYFAMSSKSIEAKEHRGKSPATTMIPEMHVRSRGPRAVS